MAYPIAENEPERLRSLQRLDILRTPPDPIFGNLCRLAQSMFDVPAAIVTIVGRDEQVFLGCVGLSVTRTPRGQAFCNYTILSDQVFVVEDASRDARFAENPLVTGEPGIRFYAGAPLALEAGRRLGSLVLIDVKPRGMTEAERSRLRDLAAVVVSEFELHRAKLEAALQRDELVASEERLSLAVKTTGLGIWRQSLEGGEFDLSKEGRTILGIAQDRDLRAHDILSSIQLSDRRRVLREFAHIRSGRSPSAHLDLRLLRSLDREERWISVTARRIERADDSLLVGTVHDITDLQVRAQQQQGLALLGQIALQEGDLNNLLNACCEILIRTLSADLACVALPDAGGRSLTLTAARGAYYDKNKRFLEEAIGSSLMNSAFKEAGKIRVVDVRVWNPRWTSDIGRRLGLESAMAVGIGEYPRRYGAISVACASARRFADAETSFLQAVGFVLAAALDRRETLAKLQLRERALQATAQGIAICDATDPNLPLVCANSALERQTGFDIAEIEGAPLLFQAQAEGSRLKMLGRLAGGGGFSGRIASRRKDGSTYQDELSISAVRDPAGNTTHYVAVHTDVTERLRLEEEVRQAQKMEAVGKLTGGVAHDFNNLLTVILGNSELIAENSDDAKLRSLAEMVVQAAEKGADMVQRLLAFGRRQDLQPEDIDINDVLLALTNLLKRSVGEEVFLRTRLSEDVLPSHVDKAQLETAILNLVVNARDAMPRGGVVTLETRPVRLERDSLPPTLSPGDYVSIRVTDTGVGIAPHLLGRVFEPFFTTKDVGKGTGLGLSMVYGFVQQSGGHASITSDVGRGTTVEILLPRLDDIAAEDEPVAAEPPARGRERILVVEDQDDVRAFVTAQLTSLGYDVAAVPDGPSAINHLQAGRRVELLFTDIIMPGGLDGIQLAERATKLQPNLQILFTTGYSDQAIARSSQLLDAGVHVLKKPYRRTELSSALRAVLSQSPGFKENRERN